MGVAASRWVDQSLRVAQWPPGRKVCIGGLRGAIVSGSASETGRVRRRLATFTGAGYSKGRSVLVCGLWLLAAEPLLRTIWCPRRIRVAVLRSFGAKIGTGVRIRHQVHIHWPWKLEIGDDSWIGVGARLLNLEPIIIGSNVCISQEALLCTGSHQADDPAFGFDNAPIWVDDGAWIATRATVLRGVRIGAGALIGATALVAKDVGNDERWLAPGAVDRDTGS